MGFDNEGNLEGFSRSMKDNMDWKVAPDGNDIKTVNAFQSAINELEETSRTETSARNFTLRTCYLPRSPTCLS